MKKIVSKTTTAIIAMTLICSFANAQTILNTGFEKEAADWQLNPAVPIAPGFEGKGFTVKPDTATSYAGKNSMHISKTDIKDSTATLGYFKQVIKGNFQGRKITLSAYVRSKDLKSGAASLWYEIHNALASDVKDMNPTYITGTSGWKKYSLEIYVTQPTDYIAVGGFLMGDGEAWFDDFSTVTAPLITDKDLLQATNILHEASTPVTLPLQESDMARMFSNANLSKIIGLGEVTHGTSEAYTIRQQLSKFLVEKRGYNIICLENSYGWTELLNDYIQTGKGNLDTLMRKNLLGIWQNEEMKQVFLWMRKYNQTHSNKIILKGMDYSQLSSAAILVKNNIANIKNDSLHLLAEKLMNYCSVVDSIFHEMDIPGFDVDYRKLSRNSISAYETAITLQQLITENKNTGFAKMNAEQFAQTQTALHNAALGNYNFYRVVKLKGDEVLRDSVMFEMVKDFEKERPSGKIIIWVHNAHIAKKPIYEDNNGGGMGSYISKYFPGQYYAIGTATANGSYAAMKGSFVTELSKFKPVELDAPVNGSLEAILNEEKRSALFVDFNKHKTDMPKIYHRVIGQGNVKGKETYVQIKPNELYDGLLFIKDTKAAASFK